MSTTKDFHLAGHGSANTSAHPSYSASQRQLVKEQLERILVSSLFRNSKRFPDFLRYTVNHALSGETEGLKERTIGTAVFGRDPDYDTSTDPVVRVTAAEVRKRITQYYEAVGHERELRIEFERGSYVPEFRFSYDADRREKPSASSIKRALAQSRAKHWVVVASVAAPCMALCIFLLGSTRQTALDRFWAPVTSTNNPALLCIPNPTPGGTLPAAAPAPGATPNTPPAFTVKPHGVALGDSIALSLVSGILGRKDKDFRVRASEDVTLEDLKEGPVVLIGAFDNRWTMKLVAGLRYTFVHDGSQGYIADVRDPGSRQWAVSSALPAWGGDSVDYGLISRVIDSTTGRAVVTVAGIHHYGTEAAAECLTETACLEAAAQLAPGDWKRTNLQIVLKTTVIGQNEGEPRVLAAYVW